MTELPAEITHGKVIGRFRLAAHDSGDVGSNPDAVPDSGRIRFVAATPYQRVLLPEPETIGTFSGVFDLDTDGYLVDEQGAQGVWVPTGTYTVDFLLKKLRIPSRVIEVTAEHTELAPLDLAIIIPPSDAEISPSQYGELSERLELVEAATDHGGLPGLADDDHPQYALADGSRGSFATVAQGAKADTAVQPAALAAHEADTTGVHGIADTSALVTTTDPRLSDARTPLAHTQAASTITDLTETVQDIVGAFLVAGTNVTVSYNDVANTFTINAVGGGGGETDPEIVRDVIGAALVAGSGIQITVNDAGDTITIASTAVLPTRQVNSGTGLTGGGDLSANRTLAVDFAASGVSSSTKAVRADDSRLSDSRTPTTHSHDDLYFTEAEVSYQLSLKAPVTQTINARTGAYTLVAADAGKLVTMTLGVAADLTVPSGVFSAGQRVDIADRGTARCTVVAGAGMTVNPPPGGSLVMEGQYAYASLVFISGTEADLVGLVVVP